MNKTKEETKIPLSVLQNLLEVPDYNKILNQIAKTERKQSLEQLQFSTQLALRDGVFIC